MMKRMEVQLKDVKIFAYHGLHRGEEIVGGEFKINLTIAYFPDDIVINKIENTIDYTQLLKVVKGKMRAPVHLLETVATEIVSEIIAKFPIITDVEISIDKLHPPIEFFEGSVGITYKVKI